MGWPAPKQRPTLVPSHIEGEPVAEVPWGVGDGPYRSVFGEARGYTLTWANMLRAKWGLVPANTSALLAGAGRL